MREKRLDARRADLPATVEQKPAERLFDNINHASRLEQIEAALEQLGYRVDARLSPA